MRHLLVIAGLMTVFGLAGCAMPRLVYLQTVPVTLSEVEQAKLEADLAKWTDQIENYAPAVPAVESAVKPATAAPDSSEPSDATPPPVDTRPPFDYFVEKARAQALLGQVGKAIRTYDEALQLYEISIVGWNNQGHLYEQIGETEAAIADFERIVGTFPASEYYLDIAKNYLKINNRVRAKQAYLKYVRETGSTDAAVAEALGVK